MALYAVPYRPPVAGSPPLATGKLLSAIGPPSKKPTLVCRNASGTELSSSSAPSIAALVSRKSFTVGEPLRKAAVSLENRNRFVASMLRPDGR